VVCGVLWGVCRWGDEADWEIWKHVVQVVGCRVKELGVVGQEQDVVIWVWVSFILEVWYESFDVCGFDDLGDDCVSDVSGEILHGNGHFAICGESVKQDVVGFVEFVTDFQSFGGGIGEWCDTEVDAKHVEVLAFVVLEIFVLSIEEAGESVTVGCCDIRDHIGMVGGRGSGKFARSEANEVWVCEVVLHDHGKKRFEEVIQSFVEIHEEAAIVEVLNWHGKSGQDAVCCVGQVVTRREI
jgi:hypothetical protein